MAFAASFFQNPSVRAALWVVKNGVQNFLFIWSENPFARRRQMNEYGRGRVPPRALTDGCTGASFLPWHCVFICRAACELCGRTLISYNVLVILRYAFHFLFIDAKNRTEWMGKWNYDEITLSHSVIWVQHSQPLVLLIPLKSFGCS